MLQPAPVSILQLNWWTCASGCAVNHSGLMCLLSSCLLRLFTCSSCGGTSFPVVLFVEAGCVALHMALVVSIFLLSLVPSAHGLLWVSAFFSHLLLYPMSSLPSLNCNYPWSVPSSCTCSTLHLWRGTPSLGVRVLFHSSSRTCAYPDWCLL